MFLSLVILRIDKIKDIRFLLEINAFLNRHKAFAIFKILFLEYLLHQPISLQLRRSTMEYHFFVLLAIYLSLIQGYQKEKVNNFKTVKFRAKYIPFYTNTGNAPFHFIFSSILQPYQQGHTQQGQGVGRWRAGLSFPFLNLEKYLLIVFICRLNSSFKTLF